MKTLFLALALIATILSFDFKNAYAEKNSSKIKIGVITGLTGAFAATGVGTARSITLACDNWNNSEAVINKSAPAIECLIEDDSFDAKKGQSAYLKFMQVDKIAALINVNSATISAISKQVRSENIPTIQVFLEGDEPSKDNIFQICPDVDEPVEALGKAVAEKYRGSVAVVSSMNDAVTRIVNSFEKGLGRKPLKYEFPLDSADVRSSVLKLVNSKPEAIVFITAAIHGIAVEKELRRLNSKIPRVFDANFLSAVNEYKTELGDLSTLSDSLLLTITMPESAARNNYKQEYLERFGETSAAWSEFGYDAVNVLMNAYDSDNLKWIEKIQATQHEGLSGQIEFSEVGVGKPYYKLTTVGEALNF